MRSNRDYARRKIHKPRHTTLQYRLTVANPLCDLRAINHKQAPPRFVSFVVWWLFLRFSSSSCSTPPCLGRYADKGLRALWSSHYRRKSTTGDDTGGGFPRPSALLLDGHTYKLAPQPSFAPRPWPPGFDYRTVCFWVMLMLRSGAFQLPVADKTSWSCFSRLISSSIVK